MWLIKTLGNQQIGEKYVAKATGGERVGMVQISFFFSYNIYGMLKRSEIF